MATQVQMAPAYQDKRRSIRRPRHNFNIRARQFTIQPFMIAPVLAGETMESLLMQARVVSDPIKNPLVGWWLQYMFFYVKLTDLDARDVITEALIHPDQTMAALNGAENLKYYHKGAGAINWSQLCLKRVVEEFFRNEGEAWDAFMDDGMPVASVNQETWTQSIMSTVETSVDDVTINTADGLTVTEIDEAYRRWQMLQMNNLVDMDYEDYLRTFGVRSERVEVHKPELIRMISDWTYPTNTIDPVTGVPSSAVSWSPQERADKNRFFREPGFVFGVTVARPKVYFKNLSRAGVSMMADALSWLPAMLSNDPRASLKGFAEGAGPFHAFNDTGSAAYWVDIKDLFTYGDQFVNYDLPASTISNGVTLPSADLSNRMYPVSADIEALFVSGLASFVRQDGVVSLNINGRQRDTSPVAAVKS